MIETIDCYTVHHSFCNRRKPIIKLFIRKEFINLTGSANTTCREMNNNKFCPEIRVASNNLTGGTLSPLDFKYLVQGLQPGQ